MKIFFKTSAFILVSLVTTLVISCDKNKDETPPEENNNNNQQSTSIEGFNLLSQVSGHWIGSNQTAYGYYPWFTYDYRPISPSHIHAIYEGATAQNILTSFFVADFDGTQKIMARNGGWLGPQYRATYFVLDQANESSQSNYYRLVDAVGGDQRSYIELIFQNDSMYFNAYKDNSGSLGAPILHMSFAGVNQNPNLAQAATNQFNFPQEVSEVNLNNAFDNLVDPGSALFLTEGQDPFPKSDHNHLSDFTVNFSKDASIQSEDMMFYLSTEPLVTQSGNVLLTNVNNKVVRTIDITSSEVSYGATYVHPGNYYLTAFADLDGNFYPSAGDVASESVSLNLLPETNPTSNLNVDITIP